MEGGVDAMGVVLLAIRWLALAVIWVGFFWWTARVLGREKEADE